jgi:hypothetical protein
MSKGPFPSGLPDLPELLVQHGLTGAREEHIAHAGFSGAHVSRLTGLGGEAFVLKRMSIERDWIMRATDDFSCREAAFAHIATCLPPEVSTPTLGIAREGDDYALLMRDITADLLPQEEIRDVELILRDVAALHAAPPPIDAPVPWCDLGKRLTLLTPRGAAIAGSYGAPVARDLDLGWALFARHASPRAREIVRALTDDVSPLVNALARLPTALLHGDLKFDNIGIRPHGGLWLIDWAMTLIAPAAVDLGWFLAINSRRMPIPLDEVMALYERTATISPEHLPRHRATTVLCGLLLRGWRKAIDADEGEPDELRWWCEAVADAARFL